MIMIFVGLWLFISIAAVLYPLYDSNFAVVVSIAIALTSLALGIVRQVQKRWKIEQSNSIGEKRELVADLINCLINHYEGYNNTVNDRYRELFERLIKQQIIMEEQYSDKLDKFQESLTKSLHNHFLSLQEIANLQKELVLQAVSGQTEFLQEKIKNMQYLHEEHNKSLIQFNNGFTGYINSLNDTYLSLFEGFSKRQKEVEKQHLDKIEALITAQKDGMEELSEAMQGYLENMTELMKKHQNFSIELSEGQNDLISNNTQTLQKFLSETNTRFDEAFKQQEKMVSIMLNSYDQMRELNQKDAELLEKIIKGM